MEWMEEIHIIKNKSYKKQNKHQMKNKKKKRSCLERQKNEQIKETQTKYKKQERHVIGEIAPNFFSATQLPSPKRARLRLAIVVFDGVVGDLVLHIRFCFSKVAIKIDPKIHIFWQSNIEWVEERII